MALHIFAHVEAQEFHAHDAGELLGDFGLADAGGAGEQIGADGLFRLAQAGARQLDGRGQRMDRLVLAIDHAAQIGFQGLAAPRHRSWRRTWTGMRAILATTSSTSLTPITFLRRLSGSSICEAPTSSITSIALSGSLRSLMYLADSSTAALMASAV